MVAETSSSTISITLRVWRQAGPDAPGKFSLETYNYGLTTPVEVRNGVFEAPTKPGIGTDLDFEMFDRTQIGVLS